jgi:hypothetical protein
MSRTKNARSANNSNQTSSDAQQLIEAIRRAACEGREEVAKTLLTMVKKGNATAMKTLLDVATKDEAPKELSRTESLKKLAQMESDPDYGVELSEETADVYPSGREPE